MIDLIRRMVFWWIYPRHLPHPASREFLDTYEWARVRYQVLLKYRDKPCMACGRGPKQGVWLSVDHILCSDCNKGKGNWDSTDWR